MHFRFGLFGDLLVRRSRIVHHRQRIQVTFVRGLRVPFVLRQIRDTFVHGSPHHLRLAFPNPLAEDSELARLVDHRFHAQDQTEFVVHLQPVFFHPVFDPRPRRALLLATREHFALEVAVLFPAQKRQDVFGRKTHRGMIQEPRVKFAEFASAGEENVRGVLRLIEDPIVIHGSEPLDLTEQGINPPGPLGKLLRPIELGEAVGEFLGGFWIFKRRKGVVPQSEPKRCTKADY